MISLHFPQRTAPEKMSLSSYALQLISKSCMLSFSFPLHLSLLYKLPDGPPSPNTLSRLGSAVDYMCGHQEEKEENVLWNDLSFSMVGFEQGPLLSEKGMWF